MNKASNVNRVRKKTAQQPNMFLFKRQKNEKEKCGAFLRLNHRETIHLSFLQIVTTIPQSQPCWDRPYKRTVRCTKHLMLAWSRERPHSKESDVDNLT